MRGFALLLARELRRRLPVHFVSAGLGLAVVAAPWLVGSAAGAHAAEVRGALAVVVAFLWSLSIALIEGFSFLASDLREARFAFDFRLPIASTAIWASRFMAAVASIATAAGVVQLCASLAGADLEWAWRASLEFLSYGSGFDFRSPVPIVLLFLLVAMLSLDLFGLALASRRPWLALDLLGVIAFKSLAFVAILPLWHATAELTSGHALVAATTAGVIALLLATWQQVSKGRTEGDRAHRAFSLTFAPTALVLVVPLLVWSHWLLSPVPSDLVESSSQTLPLSEGLIWLSGPRSFGGEVEHQFLVEPGTGRSVRLGTQHKDLSDLPAKISLDGSTIAWIEPQRVGRRSWSSRLRIASNTSVFSGLRPSGVLWDGFPLSWALSLDGSRVASLWRTPDGNSWPRLEVADLGSGQVIDQISLRRCPDPGPLLFLDDHRLISSCANSWGSSNSSLQGILLIDLEAREIGVTGIKALFKRPVDHAFARTLGRWFEPPDERSEALGSQNGRIHREDRGQVPIEPPSDSNGPYGVDSARFCSDGRLAVAWRTGAERRLATYDSSGVLQSSLLLQADEVDLLAELRGALLVLTLRYEASRIPTARLFRIPLDGGSPVEIDSGLYPFRPEAASTPTTLFSRPRGGTLWLDLSTEKLVPLFAAF